MEDATNTLSFNQEVSELIEIVFEDYDFAGDFLHYMSTGEGELAFNRKTLKKSVDETWITAIEQAIPAIDRIIRSPSKDIKEEEEILPIELSRNVSARSLVHLSQHTNFINSIDENGMVMPSKILNVYKEENYLTYENKFINTLIDRLYIFIHMRYDQLSEQAEDEYCNEMKLNFDFEREKTEVKISLNITTRDRKDPIVKAPPKNEDEEEEDDEPDFSGRSDLPIIERVRNLMAIVTGYKNSPFAAKLGNNYVRPPIMRTNAIMKNQYLKQCLVLWQFIESYEGIGFEISGNETAEKPPAEIMNSIYSLLAMQYMLFRQSSMDDPEANKIKKRRHTTKPVAPKIVKNFNDEIVDDYNYYEVEGKKVLAIFPGKSKRKLTPDEAKLKKEIDKALMTEKRNKNEKTKAKAKRYKSASADKSK